MGEVLKILYARTWKSASGTGLFLFTHAILKYMIEVEKKFVFDKDSLDKLIDEAEFISQKSFTDVYFDMADYALTKADTWLRCRDGRFELKVALQSHATRSIDQYEELETEETIKKKLGITTEKPLSQDLPSLGYEPFASIVTTRTKYKKNGFIIDIDAMDYGYDLVEIELMVDAKEEIESATKKIMSFASSRGLEIGKVRGKVIEYLNRKNPEHFRALESAWGVKL